MKLLPYEVHRFRARLAYLRDHAEQDLNDVILDGTIDVDDAREVAEGVADYISDAKDAIAWAVSLLEEIENRTDIHLGWTITGFGEMKQTPRVA